MAGMPWVLSAVFELTEEVKKSRFICRAGPAPGVDQAMAFLEQVREARATHNCWAYRVGQQLRFSDDGEPGGTAGRPILGALEKQHVDQAMVVVTRYFGGVKLGAGGLARAYGGIASRCLQQAPRQELIPMITRTVQVPFVHVGTMRAVVGRRQATVISESFDQQGATYEIELEQAGAEDLQRALADATSGQAVFLGKK